ncbi:MAG TPA: 50S ribosomal protein L7/L12 [Halomicronema sp.]
MVTNTEILEKIKSLTGPEKGELVKRIEEAFGVHACRPIEKYSQEWYRRHTIIDYFSEEEKEQEFDLVLEEVPTHQRISVLKTLRQITGLGLAALKELIDSVPQTVKGGISASVAEELKAKLEAAGGYVSLK